MDLQYYFSVEELLYGYNINDLLEIEYNDINKKKFKATLWDNNSIKSGNIDIFYDKILINITNNYILLNNHYDEKKTILDILLNLDNNTFFINNEPYKINFTYNILEKDPISNISPSLILSFNFNKLK